MLLLPDEILETINMISTYSLDVRTVTMGISLLDCIDPSAEKTAENISDNYFASRPDGSKLGAIVSPQSEVIPNREFLENNLKQLEKEWEGKEILRPAHWGGFLVRPVEVEFWQGRPNRLHDRIRYKLSNEFDWKIERLSP